MENAQPPYSMVTAMGAPVVPADMQDNEILINDWLADDLQARPGDTLRLKYFVPGPGRVLDVSGRMSFASGASCPWPGLPATAR